MNWTKIQKLVKQFEEEAKEKRDNEEYKKILSELNIEQI